MNYSGGGVKKPFANWFFIILVYLACLVTGLIVISLGDILGGLIFGGMYIPAILVVALLGTSVYFSLGYFGIKKSTMFILTISLSVLISISTFLVNYYTVKTLNELSSVLVSAPEGAVGGLSTLLNVFNVSALGNVWIVICFTLFFYNLLPIINFFKD